MPEPEERDLGMRTVSAHLLPAPSAIILGGGSQAFHRYLLEGRKPLSDEETGPYEEWAKALNDQQQDRELPVQYWRGVFLDRFFALEHNIGVALARHFQVAEDQSDEWEEWMLGRVSFHQKMQLIQRVVTSRGLERQFPGLYAHIERMNQFRNVLAHGMIEPIDDDGMVGFLYFRWGVFKAQKYRLIDLYLDALRVTSLTWQVDRLWHVIVGREWELGDEDPFLETVRQFYAVRPGTCPACGDQAALQYEPAEDAWKEPDFTGEEPIWVACINPDCARYESQYAAMVGADTAGKSAATPTPKKRAPKKHPAKRSTTGGTKKAATKKAATKKAATKKRATKKRAARKPAKKSTKRKG